MADGGAAPGELLSPPEACPGGLEARRSHRSFDALLARRVSPGTIVVLVGLVTLVGLLLRLPSFTSSLFGDETSTYYIVVGHSFSRVMQLVHSNQEVSPPLYFILAWASQGILSNPGESIRLTSLVAGVAAIPLTYMLGSMTVGRRAGLVGSALVALLPFLIFYSTDARPYMLAATLALVSTIALLRALDTRRAHWWAVYAAASCAAAYAHYTVVFVLAAQILWALVTRRDAWRPLLAANAAAVVLYVPWIGGLRQDLHGPNFIAGFQPFSLHAVGSYLGRWTLGHPVIPLGQMPGYVALWVVAAGMAVGLLGWGARACRRGTWRRRPSSRVVLVVLLAAATPVGAAIESAVSADVFSSQNLIASSVALALVGAAVVTRPARLPRAAAAGLVVAGFAVGGARMVTPAAQRPDVGAAVSYIERFGSPGDPIVSLPLTANPLSELDVALADSGRPQRHPVLRLGVPPLAAQLRSLAGPRGQPLNLSAPPVPGQVIARQAVGLARRGTIFVVSPIQLKELAFFPSNPMATVLRALPPSFHVVAERTFPGFEGWFPEIVYVLRDTGDTGHRPLP